MIRRWLVVWVLGTSLLLGASWQPIQAKTKIAVTDAAGRTVMVAAPADRAVVLFNYEEFLAAVGPGAFDRVVGFTKTVWYDWRRSIWNKYVTAIPKIGQVPDVGVAIDGTFSTEKVIALHPDVVIMPRWAYEALGPAVKQMEDAGIPSVVIDYNAMRVETHVAGTLAIGKVMGTETRAREVADFYAQGMAIGSGTDAQQSQKDDDGDRAPPVHGGTSSVPRSPSRPSRACGWTLRRRSRQPPRRCQ